MMIVVVVCTGNSIVNDITSAVRMKGVRRTGLTYVTMSTDTTIGRNSHSRRIFRYEFNISIVMVPVMDYIIVVVVVVVWNGVVDCADFSHLHVAVFSDAAVAKILLTIQTLVCRS